MKRYIYVCDKQSGAIERWNKKEVVSDNWDARIYIVAYSLNDLWLSLPWYFRKEWGSKNKLVQWIKDNC